MKISIVVPSYNERDNIRYVIDACTNIMKKIDAIIDFEFIVVDDHSSDKTFEALTELGNPKVNCLRLSRRSGSHTALRAGIANADGDAVLCISADGQNDPACLDDMLLKLRNGGNIVWALREDRKDEPWYVNLPAIVFYRFIFWFSDKEDRIADLSRVDFFLLSKRVVEAINSCAERNTSIFGLIAHLGFKQDFSIYRRQPRHLGRSKWNFKRRLQLAMDWIIAFSGLPLKLASILGVLAAILGFGYGLYITINTFRGVPMPGWSPAVATILFIGGIQMIMLGIMGEYLWRNLDESRKRPLYFIEQKIKQ